MSIKLRNSAYLCYTLAIIIFIWDYQMVRDTTQVLLWVWSALVLVSVALMTAATMTIGK